MGLDVVAASGAYMVKRHKAQLDIYSELCPASSATIIGAGLVTLSMGSVAPGVACVVAGIGVGIMGTVAKSIHGHRIVKKR